MKRVLLSTMHLIAGAGAAIFLSFTVAAALLIFFQYHPGSLALDQGGPFWPFGRVTGGCASAALAWGGLWRRVSAIRRNTLAGESLPVAEHRPISLGLLTTTSL